MSTATATPNVKNSYEKNLQNWIENEKAAIELIGVIGNLWFDRSVELII
ncbi:MAG: hypothetical protein IT239_06835, partial [Bacteroidia bacterium]|nr:hypothetical protein [Bacteroidia bacterium]